MNADMDPFDFWRLCDELTVVQAALLVAGIDPSSEEGVGCDDRPVQEQPRGYAAAKAAMTHAARSGSLAVSVRHSAREVGEADYQTAVDFHEIGEDAIRMGPDLQDALDEGEAISHNGVFIYRVTPDWHLSTVRVDALREWLARRGLSRGFFFTNLSHQPEYLDAKHRRYAPKLAAAVRAWLDVADVPGRTPKQSLERWLREHSAEYGLSDDEGKPNELGIQECAKVANWQPSGGAPRTPGA